MMASFPMLASARNTGSTMIPCSDRLTLSTSPACASALMLLCTTPSPPSRASGHSHAGFRHRIHGRREQRHVQNYLVSELGCDVSIEESTSDMPGTNRTSSKVSPHIRES